MKSSSSWLVMTNMQAREKPMKSMMTERKDSERDQAGPGSKERLIGASLNPQEMPSKVVFNCSPKAYIKQASCTNQLHQVEPIRFLFLLHFWGFCVLNATSDQVGL